MISCLISSRTCHGLHTVYLGTAHTMLSTYDAPSPTIIHSSLVSPLLLIKSFATIESSHPDSRSSSVTSKPRASFRFTHSHVVSNLLKSLGILRTDRSLHTEWKQDFWLHNAPLSSPPTSCLVHRRHRGAPPCHRHCHHGEGIASSSGNWLYPPRKKE